MYSSKKTQVRVQCLSILYRCISIIRVSWSGRASVTVMYIVVFQVRRGLDMTHASNRKRAGCVAFVLIVSFLLLRYHGRTNLFSVEWSGHTSTNVADTVTEQSDSLSATLAYDTSTYYDLLPRCEEMEIRAFQKTKSSGLYSKIELVTQGQSGMNTIKVHIQTFDQQNRSKTFGGDLLYVIVTSDKVGGRVAGHVIDHGDGQYTGVVRLLWTDQVQIHVRIGSTLENVCLRHLAIKKFGNAVFTMKTGTGIRGYYKTNGGVREFTHCGANAYIYGYNNTCNFTQLNDNMSWYCGKPRRTTLQCTDIQTFNAKAFNVSAATQFEKIILPSVETLKDKVRLEYISDQTQPNQFNTNLEKCSVRSSVYSWREGMDQPSGYWYNG